MSSKQDSGDASPRKTVRRRGEGRQRILNAAIDLFADFGFDAISTNDVARVSNTSQSVVIYHFKTKEELWRQAMTELFRRVDARSITAQAEYKDLNVLDRLRILIRRFVTMSARYPQLGRVVYREGVNGGPRLDWLVSELAGDQYKVFVDLLREAVEKKLIRSYSPVAMTLLIHSAGATLFNLSHLSRILLGSDPFDPALVEQQSDMLVDVVLNGLVSTKPA